MIGTNPGGSTAQLGLFDVTVEANEKSCSIFVGGLDLSLNRSQAAKDRGNHLVGTCSRGLVVEYFVRELHCADRWTVGLCELRSVDKFFGFPGEDFSQCG